MCVRDSVRDRVCVRECVCVCVRASERERDLIKDTEDKGTNSHNGATEPGV